MVDAAAPMPPATVRSELSGHPGPPWHPARGVCDAKLSPRIQGAASISDLFCDSPALGMTRKAGALWSHSEALNLLTRPRPSILGYLTRGDGSWPRSVLGWATGVSQVLEGEAPTLETAVASLGLK